MVVANSWYLLNGCYGCCSFLLAFGWLLLILGAFWMVAVNSSAPLDSPQAEPNAMAIDHPYSCNGRKRVHQE